MSSFEIVCPNDLTPPKTKMEPKETPLYTHPPIFSFQVPSVNFSGYKSWTMYTPGQTNIDPQNDTIFEAGDTF